MSLIKTGRQSAVVTRCHSNVRLADNGGLKNTPSGLSLQENDGLIISSNGVSFAPTEPRIMYNFRIVNTGSQVSGSVFSVGDAEKASIRSYPIFNNGTITRMAILGTNAAGTALTGGASTFSILVNGLSSGETFTHGGTVFSRVYEDLNISVTSGQTLGLRCNTSWSNRAYTVSLEMTFQP